VIYGYSLAHKIRSVRYSSLYSSSLSYEHHIAHYKRLLDRRRTPQEYGSSQSPFDRRVERSLPGLSLKRGREKKKYVRACRMVEFMRLGTYTPFIPR